MSAYDFEGNDWDDITEGEKRRIVDRLVRERDALSDDYETLVAEHDLCAARSEAAAPPGLTDDERKSLEAVVHYSVERGDEDGALSTNEGWAIARSVVAGLTSGEVRHTTSILKPGFSVEVRVVRATPECGRRGCSMPQPHDHFEVTPSPPTHRGGSHGSRLPE